MRIVLRYDAAAREGAQWQMRLGRAGTRRDVDGERGACWNHPAYGTETAIQSAFLNDMHFRATIAALLFLLVFGSGTSKAISAKDRQQALEQWKELTSSNASPPRLFVKGNEVRLCFEPGGKTVVFKAAWKKDRAPTDNYRIGLGKLRATRARPPSVGKDGGWEEAIIIAGAEGQKIGAALLERLTPATPGHGVAFEALFADRVLYRDAQGISRLGYQEERPPGIVIDHHFFPGESLEVLAKHLDEILAGRQPNDHLFVIMTPDAGAFMQPLLIDRRRHECVGLRLAALFEAAEPGLGFKVAADGFSALLLESHCIALIKNPLSSVARLVDACVQDAIRLVRVPALNLRGQFIPATPSGAMDLVKWEQWLDRHTGTKLEDGSLRLLNDGDQFFPRLEQAIREATNHIFGDVYLFDRDDVGIEVADLLKQRANEVPVKVTYDRLCSLIGGMLPKLTPMRQDFEPPFPIGHYLRKDSKVEVRPFLNPWISVNHSKLFLVDGHQAWIGGMNLGREYVHEWHDFMVEINGPVVTSLESQFQKEWAHAGPWGDFGYIATAAKQPQQLPPASASERSSQVRRLPTSKGLRKPFKTAVLTSLDQARSYVYIENGYLFDHGVVASLIRARKRGVDVRVILPRVNNFTMGIRSNLATAESLRRKGIRVYFWPGMTHAKVVLADGWSCLGSANLNQWSLRLSEEENIATSDPVFAQQVKSQVFEADFARCYELKERIPLNFTDHIVDRFLSY